MRTMLHAPGRALAVRRSLFPGVAAASLLVLGGCVADGALTEPEVDASVAVQLAVIPSASNSTALPINRIRAVTTRASGGALLDETVQDVSPDATEWEVLLELDGVGEGTVVVVTLYLINVAGDGTEEVQFSGRSDPITVSYAEPVEPDVPIVRGPLENLFTTGVSILDAPNRLLEGETAAIAADATTSGTTPPTVFWSVGDSTVLRVDGETLVAASVGTTELIASAGAFADTAMVTVESSSMVFVDASFDAGLGQLVAVAFDPRTGNVLVYDDFSTVINEFDATGTEVGSPIPFPGTVSNDIDLEFLPVGTNVGGVDVPSNTLLVINGEDSPRTVYALDKDDGSVLATLTLPLSSTVGGAYSPARGTLFAVDWSADLVFEFSLATGSEVTSFPVAPVGASPFDVFYGDVEVDPRTGEILLVSDAQTRVRFFTPGGVFVRDVDVAPAGIAQMSGIAWDEVTRRAWISSRSGFVWRVGGLGF